MTLELCNYSIKSEKIRDSMNYFYAKYQVHYGFLLWPVTNIGHVYGTRRNIPLMFFAFPCGFLRPCVSIF